MTNKNIISESLETHLFIEFYYNKQKGFLLEHLKSEQEEDSMLKSYGLFNGCEQVMEKVYTRLMRVTPADIKNGVEIPINNKIFGSMWIIFRNNIPTSYYDFIQTGYDEEKNILTPVIFALNPNALAAKNLKTIIAHELTHAYQDYRLRHDKDITLYNFMYDKGYFNNNVVKAKEYPKLKSELSEIIYYFSNIEKGAYISEITAELRTCDEYLMDISDAIKYLRNTAAYKNYVRVMSNCEDFYSITDKDTQKEIIGDMESLSGYKFESYKSFRRWLAKTAYKTRMKFENVFSKVAYQTLSISGFPMPRPEKLNNDE